MGIFTFGEMPLDGDTVFMDGQRGLYLGGHTRYWLIRPDMLDFVRKLNYMCLDIGGAAWTLELFLHDNGFQSFNTCPQTSRMVLTEMTVLNDMGGIEIGGYR